MALGEEIVRQRDRQGLSQTDLAKKAGINQPTLQKTESGARKTPSVQLVWKIAHALDVSVETLIVSAGSGKSAALSAMRLAESAPQGSLEARVAALERETLEAHRTARDALALAQQLRDAKSTRRRPSGAS
jgi:transcriptional regulator with XRE-family HTH domain